MTPFAQRGVVCWRRPRRDSPDCRDIPSTGESLGGVLLPCLSAAVEWRSRRVLPARLAKGCSLTAGRYPFLSISRSVAVISTGTAQSGRAPDARKPSPEMPSS